MSGTRPIPLRHSLVVRLLAASLVVAVSAVVGTAWLVMRSTTAAIRQERGYSLAADKNIYDFLLRYATAYRDWSGVAPILRTSAQRMGRRITLTTTDRRPVADSANGHRADLSRPSATVDPLEVDPGLAGGTERIDPRVTGPYLLPSTESGVLQTLASERQDCLRRAGIPAEVIQTPRGRPQVSVPPPLEAHAGESCPPGDLVRPTPTETAPLRDLAQLADACLPGTGRAVRLDPYFAFTVVDGAGTPLALTTGESDATRECVTRARQIQLRPFVAPPALLFLTAAGGATETVVEPSRAGLTSIALTVGGILTVVVLMTLLMGRRLTRPLRLLADTVGRPAPAHPRPPPHRRDEIGRLAAALDDLTARREQVERQRRTMVSDIAHELRTPLTNMRGLIEAGLDGFTPADAGLLARLLDEAVLLQHVVDDLRDLADADAGNLRIHRDSVAAGDLLAQVLDSHRAAADTAGVALRTDLGADPDLDVDPVRLRQILGNLMSNAIRHTPAGGTVTLRLTAVAGGHDISVCDTGTGIPAAELERIFDRFWRADRSRSRHTGGSGLGLAIARRLAEAHGGGVSVTSRVGVGTTFTVRLPDSGGS